MAWGEGARALGEKWVAVDERMLMVVSVVRGGRGGDAAGWRGCSRSLLRRGG